MVDSIGNVTAILDWENTFTLLSFLHERYPKYVRRLIESIDNCSLYTRFNGDGNESLTNNVEHATLRREFRRHFVAAHGKVGEAGLRRLVRELMRELKWAPDFIGWMLFLKRLLHGR